MYKYKKLNRSLSIFLLFTLLFLPFQKPKKTEAFAWVIPPLALEGVKIAGGALLTFLGLEFATKAHAELFGENFAEKAAIGLVYKVATSDGFSWVPGSSMTGELWNNWTKEVTLPQNTTDFIGELISNLPVPGAYDGYVEMLTSGPYAVTETVSIKILDVTGSDTRIDYRLFDSSTTGGTFRYKFNKDDVYKLTLENGNACIRLANGNLLYNFYNQDRLWFWDMKVGIGQSVLIPNDIYNNLDKDKLTTTFPVGHSMDVSNATSIPLTQEQVKDVGITVDKDSSLDGVTKPITGWDWLDNILNSILGWLESIYNWLVSIPAAISNFFTIDWDLVREHLVFDEIFREKFKPFYDLTSLLQNIKANPQNHSGKFYMTIPKEMGGDGKEHCVLDLTVADVYISFARKIIDAAIWIGFLYYILKTFSPKFNIG